MSFNHLGYLQPDVAEIRTYNQYNRKFAYLPVWCKDRTLLWMKPYYRKYIVHSYTGMPDRAFFQYNLTEHSALIDKLVGDIDSKWV